MIGCYVKGYKENNIFLVTIPHEISHYFIGEFKKTYEGGKIEKVDYILPDHYLKDLKIKVSNLDDLEKDYQFLYDNLDKIIKIAPLPKNIGKFDGYYYNGFIEVIKDRIDREVYGEREFSKDDMLLLINLVRIKIFEAKEKNLPLIFSGD